MNTENLQKIIAEIAHDANLTWGYATNTVANRTPYRYGSDTRKKNETKYIASGADFHVKNPNLTLEDGHNIWLKKSHEDHPLHIPYSSLSFDDKAKMAIYQGLIKIYIEISKLEQGD